MWEPWGARASRQDEEERQLMTTSPFAQDVANPAAMILSATMMLRHLGLDHHANQIAAAVYRVIADGKIRTPDMGGTRSVPPLSSLVLAGARADEDVWNSHTSDMTFAIIKALST